MLLLLQKVMYPMASFITILEERGRKGFHGLRRNTACFLSVFKSLERAIGEAYQETLCRQGLLLRLQVMHKSILSGKVI
jgi:hypothetical protein